MHGLAVYMKERLPFARDLSLENSTDSYLCFRLAFLHLVSQFYFLYRSPSSALCTVFDSISSNIDDVLSINPSANVFVIGEFNVHHKDWLTQMNFLVNLLRESLTILLRWLLSYSLPRLWFSQSCSYGFISFF